MADPSEERKRRNRYRGFEAAFVLGAEIGLPTFLGWWGDKQLGTSPLLVLIGVTLGLGGGLYHFIREFTPKK